MLQNLKNRKSDQKGFTIIEVLIVLAIAGLILLIVFLAVPALQRSSRNTQRKNDVAALLAAVSEYANNNNGVLPTTGSQATPGVALFGTAGNANAPTSQAKVGYYNSGYGTAQGDFTIGAVGAATAAGTFNAATKDYVLITAKTECSGKASIAGSARSFTAIYEIETGGGNYSQECQAS